MGLEPSPWDISLSDIDFGAEEDQAGPDVVRASPG